MRILVTGGVGRVGTAVIERLTRAGHDLTVIGRRPHADVKGARYRQCDILDMDCLLAAVKEADTVVHLAAIPGPGGFPPESVFRSNCQGTMNVYEAAARAGIRKLVSASSINAVGYNYGNKAFPIAYLPVDEEMPVYSTDAYSFSKQVTERIGEYAWRRDGITSIGLRLPWVAPAQHSSREIVAAHAALCRASFEALMKLPETDRRRTAQDWVEHRNRYRTTRDMEALDGGKGYDHPDPLMVGRTDFWTRIDERDSAQAIERCLSAEYEGYHTLFANDTHSYTGVPTLLLAELFFPESALRREKLSGYNTLVSVEAAERLIGFAPEFSVSRWL